MEKRFNPAKLEKLNNPARLEMIPPEYIWKKLNLTRHSDKIEIGAGTGLFSIEFQRLSGTGSTKAIDISEEMIGWMTEHIVPQNPDIVPILTDGKSIPADDCSADLVYTITVHHELEDPDSMLSEIYRVLRNGARLFIIDWSALDTEPEFGPPAAIRCRPDEVVPQLKKAGFINIETDERLKGFFLITAEKPV